MLAFKKVARVSCVGLSSILVGQSLKVMIHLHTKHQDGFNVFMRGGVKSWCLDVILWDDVSWNTYNACVQTDTWVTRGLWLIRTCTIHPDVYIMFCHFLFFDFCFSFLCFSFLRFWVYIFYKHSRDLTRPLGVTKGFKGLVAYTKCNRDSYESELVIYFSFSFGFLLALFTFCRK